ncbi:MAG: nitroreductase family deazaflavin-dependent oxidoreductase [Chloroflexota bacterium]
MATGNDWNNSIIKEFRENEGKVGGMFEGAPMVLLHTKGAKSGKERVNPLMFLPEGDRVIIFASKGGAPAHPDWFRNLKANPDVEAEVGTEKFAAKAEEITGPERDKLFAEQAKRYPQFAEYVEKAQGRVIPVIALKRK